MRFLCTAWNFPGCLHPFFALARALSMAGHDVGFYTGENYRETIEREGWRYFPFRPTMERIVEEKVFSRNSIGANWHRPWRVPRLLKEFFVDSIPWQVSDLRTFLDEWRPQGIVSDPAMFAPHLVLHETTGIPVGLLSYVLGCMIPSREVPPVGLGLRRPRNRFDRIYNRAMGTLTDWRLSPFRDGVNRYRAGHGLSEVTGPVVTHAAKLPLYLVTSCRALDYPRSVPPNVHYVGGCFWYPPLETPEWVDRLPAEPPCVYVNEGTIHVADPFVLRAARQGLADEPLRVILTTGKHRTIEEMGLAPLPENFIAADWVNHSALMGKIRAMVCTGGPGTVLSALYRNVPMVVVATEWDHPENAQRLAEAGVAIRLRPSECKPKRLREAVRTILNEPSYVENAARIGAELRKLGGARRAAELVARMGAGTLAADHAEQPAVSPAASRIDDAG